MFAFIKQFFLFFFIITNTGIIFCLFLLTSKHKYMKGCYLKVVSPIFIKFGTRKVYDISQLIDYKTYLQCIHKSQITGTNKKTQLRP